MTINCVGIRFAILNLLSLFCGVAASAEKESDSNWLRLEPGTFQMGSDAGNFDERPRHKVTLSQPVVLSAREVTNAEFEQFNPKHRSRRGKSPESKADDDPVVFVSWDDAAAYCQWRSKQEGRAFRLPTEAEWESARAKHPDAFSGQSSRVENWCHDWYGPYPAKLQVDPLGYSSGEIRVTRGGPHLAEAGLPHPTRRSGSIPGDRNRVIGFRVVQGELPSGTTLADRATPRWAADVKSAKHQWKPTVDMAKPYFAEPIPYVKIPDRATGPLFTQHNHDPGLTYCDNGDLLAIWYSTIKEPGRELAIAGSRLRNGTNSWDQADLFWDVPNRNDHAPALLNDGRGTLVHFNGLDVDEKWDELALVLRTSQDNGVTWSPARLINPDHQLGNMPIGSVFRDERGTIYLPCDAVTGGHGGTVVHNSTDGGKTWKKPAHGKPTPKFADGATGGWIAGIHAGVAGLSDGTLLAFGRGDNINGKMPMSRSSDGAQSWTYSASPFKGISGGQRLVLRKLKEGPLLFISFTPGETFTDAASKEFTGQGMYAALSDDGGKTWPVRKLLTDGKRRELDGKAHTKKFTMDATHAEPKGYLTAVQTPDGIIHLISSGIHYRFNLEWLREPAKAVTERS